MPRCLFLDLESTQIDKLFLQKDVIIDPNCCFSKNCGSGNVFATGKYTEGAELMDECKHVLDNYFEQSDKLQGIMMFFSTGGGSGSGIASNLIQYFREKDLTKIVHCNPVFQSGVTRNYLEIYNTVLIIHSMIETVDIVTIFDNVALYSKLFNFLYVFVNIYKIQMNQLHQSIKQLLLKYNLQNYKIIDKIQQSNLNIYAIAIKQIQIMRIIIKSLQRAQFKLLLHIDFQDLQMVE